MPEMHEQPQARADYDHTIRLVTDFENALDALIGEHSKRGLGPQEVRTVLVNVAHGLNGET